LFVLADARRIWRVFLIHVLIVAGICLPILILAGLKRGHVADMTIVLRTSPTGRQLIVSTGPHGPIMDDGVIEGFEALPTVDIAIPEVLQTQASVAKRVEGNVVETEDLVTFYSTRPGDPILAKHNIDVMKPDDRGLVLSLVTAKQIQAKVGDLLQLTIYRKGGEEASVDFRLRGICPEGVLTEGGGYMHTTNLNLIWRYIHETAVPEWNLPASPTLSAPDQYAGYFIFCKKSDDLQDSDREFLAGEGYRLVDVKDTERRTLFGLLRKESLEELSVYYLDTPTSGSNAQSRLWWAPSDIARKTRPDDVVLPWNAPGIVDASGTKLRLVGCSLPELTWIKRYLSDRDLAFGYDSPELSIRFPGMAPRVASETIALQLEGDESVEMIVQRTESEQTAPETVDSQPEDGDQNGKQAKEKHSPPEDHGRDEPDPRKSGHEKQLEHSEVPVGNVEGSPDEGIGTDRIQPDMAPEGAPRTPADEKRSSQPPEEADDQGTQAEKQVDPRSDNGGRTPPTKQEAPHQAKTESIPGERTSLDNVESSLEKPARPPATAAVIDRPEPQEATSPSVAQSEPILAVVPIQFLAHLDSYHHGTAEFDPVGKRFVPVVGKPKYNQARVYAQTIYDVPELARCLRTQGFVDKSEKTRIEEIEEQDESLSLLVSVVKWVVLLFGVLEVGIVLWDSTNRRRRDLGILRIMGVSGWAVLYMVMFRAALIGICASVVAGCVGWGGCAVLSMEVPDGWGDLVQYKPVANATLDFREDWRIVVFVAFVCSLVGSVVPAISASRVDPFDAVVSAVDT